MSYASASRSERAAAWPSSVTDPRDTVAIGRNRLDEVVAMRPFRGAWAQLRARTNDAAAPFGSHGRRLRAEREAERIFEMSPAQRFLTGSV